MIYTNENWKPSVTYCKTNKVEAQKMNKEKAIEKLQKQKAEYLEDWVDYGGVAEAFDMAIEALQEPVKHGEWIDRIPCQVDEDAYH